MSDGTLSQDEINALLAGGELNNASANSDNTNEENQEFLTNEEKDAIGEVSNISMGSSATALATLINERVDITTPVVSYAKWQDIIETYAKPCVMVHISYIEGLDGKNVLMLAEDDVRIITDLMMGGDGKNVEGEISELHLSAISEAMNQMMGTSATSLSSMIGRKVDISPPSATLVDITMDEESLELESFLKETFVMVSFKLEVGDLINSRLMQLYPIEFAKEVYNKFAGGMGEEEAEKPQEAPPQAPQEAAQAPQAPPQMVAPPQDFAGQVQPDSSVNVSPVQFTSFASSGGITNPTLQTENMNLIMDVPLEVTVELGRTNRTIKEILNFKPGTIVELDKITGEPVDILVNGKVVAKGEVVVIDESFGIRVTDIIK